MTAQQPTTSAIRALAMEFKSLQEEPVEGFTVKLINEDLFEWQVAIFGPPSTLYEGAYFKVRLLREFSAGSLWIPVSPPWVLREFPMVSQ